MGPFFYSKKEIPAKPRQFISLSFLMFFDEIPPRAITFLLVSLVNNLNLLIPKKFLFLLNNEDKKIILTPCFSLVLISKLLCADPIIKKFFGIEYAR